MIRQSLALALAGALAACAASGTQTPPPNANSSAAQPAINVTTAGLAKAEGTSSFFPPPPAGYRGLGGALLHGGSLNIVTAEMSAPLEKHDMEVGLMHGMAVGTYSEEKTSVRRADCQGAGDTPQSAITVQGLKDPAVEEVAAGIACARLLHPGTRWVLSQAIAGERGYLSQVVLDDGSGTPVVVYTDVNRMAGQLIQELGG